MLKSLNIKTRLCQTYFYSRNDKQTRKTHCFPDPLWWENVLSRSVLSLHPISEPSPPGQVASNHPPQIIGCMWVSMTTLTGTLAVSARFTTGAGRDIQRRYWHARYVGCHGILPRAIVCLPTNIIPYTYIVPTETDAAGV